MALSKTDKTLQQLHNTEKNGFMDVEGSKIRDCAEFIMTPTAQESSLQSAKCISSTFGNFIAWVLNGNSVDPKIAKVPASEYLNMYLYVANATYEGKKVEYLLHTLDSGNPLEWRCAQDLRRLKIDESDTGMEKMPDKVLQLVIGGRAAAIYYPKWKIFIPGTMRAGSSLYEMTAEEFIASKPYVAHRCRAILTNMLDHGADSTVIENALGLIGGPVADHEMEKYRAEVAETISADVAAYIKATSPEADPAAVCGSMGTNRPGLLLDFPVLINTGTAPMRDINDTFGEVGNNLMIIPAVRNVTHIYNTTYEYGPRKENGIPAWIEFCAELDGTLYHKIYVGNFRKCRPNIYVDMAYMVPDGILSKYNYLVQDSAAGASGNKDEIQVAWKVYPDDNTTTEVELCSTKNNDKWNIIQRSSRIERMELYDTATGEILGTVLPEKAPMMSKTRKNLYVTLDPAGMTTVRLVSVHGSGVSEGLAYKKLIYPITPVAGEEFDLSAERHMVAPNRCGTHFDSLFQTFSANRVGGWSSLMVEGRIWEPEGAAIFKALKKYPGTMIEAMRSLDVITNMKELISHINLPISDKRRIVTVFKHYIGTMLFEAILALSREGYAVQFENLKFLISYPENGTGEGITAQLKDIIMGAIGYVNEYLEPVNRLQVGTNVFLYSESESTAVWHQTKPPVNIFIGKDIAAGTPDIGHSTHDFSLRVGNCLYIFSVPYAAQRITNATLAKVYDNHPEDLMRCFIGGNEDLKEQAYQALKDVMESKHGELHERLGFLLALGRLFSNCTFNVTGANADIYQLRVQELTEAKLNIAIPAYANAIVRAIKDGALKLVQDILLAPVGKGSLTYVNTAPGFEKRFITRLCNEINYLIERDGSFPKGTKYAGEISLLPNNDKDKESVAQGMIYIREDQKQHLAIVPVQDPTEHYLDLAYGSGEAEDTEAKEKFCEEVKDLEHPGKIRELNEKKTELYKRAFDKLIDDYTYDDFESSFYRFGYTAIDQGIPEEERGVLDDCIRDIVKTQFANLSAQVKQQRRELIMSCPFIEKEMVCGALIDLAIDRMSLFSDGQ